MIHCQKRTSAAVRWKDETGRNESDLASRTDTDKSFNLTAAMHAWFVKVEKAKRFWNNDIFREIKYNFFSHRLHDGQKQHLTISHERKETHVMKRFWRDNSRVFFSAPEILTVVQRTWKSIPHKNMHKNITQLLFT